MNRHHRPPGFVLLMTVVLLALVAVLLVGLSRRSVTRAVEAVTAQDRLQRRWGAASCRSVLLSTAPTAIARASTLQGRPVTTLRRTIRLGDQDFVLVIADEQAKANVNVLYARLGEDGAAIAVRRLLPPPLAGERVTLRPGHAEQSTSGEDATPPLAPFGSWTQVFDDADASRLFGSDSQPLGLTAQITCWGDGRVNLRRAPAPVIEAAVQPHLGSIEARRLVEARDARPEAKVADLLAAIGLSDEARKTLAATFTDSSSCYSVSIVTLSPYRRSTELAIGQTVEAEQAAPGESQSEDETRPSEQEAQHRVIRLVW